MAYPGCVPAATSGTVNVAGVGSSRRRAGQCVGWWQHDSAVRCGEPAEQRRRLRL